MPNLIGPTTQEVPALPARNFLEECHLQSNKVPLATKAVWLEGQTQPFIMPPNGWLKSILISISGSITVATTGSITAGTWKNVPYPVPFSIIRQMRFGNNNNRLLRSHTLWDLYFLMRIRNGVDPLNLGYTPAFSTKNLAIMGFTAPSGQTRPVPGANIGAGTFSFNFSFVYYVAYNAIGEKGILNLQSNYDQFKLDIDWGNVTNTGAAPTTFSNDVFSGITATGLTVTASIATSMVIDWYQPIAYPNMSNQMGEVVSIKSYTQLLKTGTNTVTPPPDDKYTVIAYTPYSNGALVDPANITNLTFQHSGNVRDRDESYECHVTRYCDEHNQVPPPDGAIVWDLGIGAGMLNRRDDILAFDANAVTNIRLEFDLPGNQDTTGQSQTTVLMESLIAVD